MWDTHGGKDLHFLASQRVFTELQVRDLKMVVGRMCVGCGAVMVVWWGRVGAGKGARCRAVDSGLQGNLRG